MTPVNAAIAKPIRIFVDTSSLDKDVLNII
jgi:hypothetical protein